MIANLTIMAPRSRAVIVMVSYRLAAYAMMASKMQQQSHFKHTMDLFGKWHGPTPNTKVLSLHAATMASSTFGNAT